MNSLITFQPLTERADLGQEKVEIALEEAAVVGLAEAPQPVEPEGVGEVMQGDKDLDALLHQTIQEIKVMRQGIVIPLPFQGFDPAPLDRHAVGPVAKGGNQLHILPIEPVVVAGLAGGGADRALRVLLVEIRQLLLVPGLGVDIVALDLMPGGGAAPQKAFRKADGRQAEDVVHN